MSRSKWIVTVALVTTLLPGEARPTGHEILTCAMDQIQADDPKTAYSVLQPLLDISGERASVELIIAGLGTTRTTAKMANYTLAVGQEIKPMAGLVPHKSSDWYYAGSEQAMTVLEIPRKGRPYVSVRLFNLGDPTYTYVGECH